jgi:hypothetical protein
MKSNLILCIVLILAFAYFFYSYEKYSFSQTEMSQIKQSESVKQIVTTDAPDMLSLYKSSDYRVVRVIDNPYSPDKTKYGQLIITSKRGINDSSCGGRYSPSECYLFLESDYDGIESPKFVGTWTSDNFPSVEPETIKFISPSIIEFKATGGDAGYSVTEKWHFNTISSTSTLISQTVSNPEW